MFINATEFSKAIEAIATTVEARSTIPVLRGALVSLDERGVTLRVTDLDVQSTVTIKGAGTRNTVAAVVDLSDLRHAAKRCKSLEHYNIEIDDNGDLMLHQRKVKAIAPTSDFPSLSQPSDGQAQFHITGEALKSALDAVKDEQSQEETRYYLNGVCVHFRRENDVAFVATDGHRLARKIIDAEGIAGPINATYIIPHKTTRLISKIADQAKEREICVAFTSARVTVTVAGVEIASKLIDGAYPDYERVIPERSRMSEPTEIKVNAKSLILFARAADAFRETGGKSMKLNANGTLELTAGMTAFRLQASVTDDYEKTGPDVEIGFSAPYIASALRDCGEYAEFLISDAGAPALISNGDETLTRVLMPLRV